jgi:hypothetical protein
MYKAILSTLLVAVPALAVAQAPQGGTFDKAGIASNTGRCGISNLPAFGEFIATKPTPVEFRAAYSCVALILPGDVTTMEMRADNSRYHAQLDEHGRIVGGSFR